MRAHCATRNVDLSPFGIYVHTMNTVVNSNPSTPPYAALDEREHEITLGLLDAITRDPTISQRRLAGELGIALGLVNAYFKRCAKKGLIKISSVPARRYAYYLTPQGFAEKARLTQTYLTHSFSFFRNARADCADVLTQCAARGWSRIALLGGGDLAEIMVLCAADHPMALLGVVAPHHAPEYMAGLKVVSSLAQLDTPDGVIVTDMAAPQAVFDQAVAQLGADSVIAPRLLRIMGVSWGTQGGTQA